MNKQALTDFIFSKKSFLSVGLDPDLEKIPAQYHQSDDPIFDFCKDIIDVTAPYCVAYKPNTAFFEVYGAEGWRTLEKVIDYIPDSHFTIADAKRGDIGNTSTRYAKAMFEGLKADSITVAPYMGSDSVKPFLQFEGKWVILLALTSNKGSEDFQYLESDELPLYKSVINASKTWGSAENMMYVVGATHPEQLKEIRTMIPDYYLLIPGVGAQGGSLSAVADAALTKECGLLVNSSRGIIYAGGDTPNHLIAVEAAAKDLQSQMEKLLAEID